MLPDDRIARAMSLTGMALLYGDAVVGASSARDWARAAYAEAWSDAERTRALECERLAGALLEVLRALAKLRADHPREGTP
jgi:hypothetical protein